MTVCYLNIYAIIYAETGSNWGYTGFSGAPVTGSGLGSGSRPSTQTGSCGSLIRILVLLNARLTLVVLSQLVIPIELSGRENQRNRRRKRGG